MKSVDLTWLVGVIFGANISLIGARSSEVHKKSESRRWEKIGHLNYANSDVPTSEPSDKNIFAKKIMS